MGFVSTHSSSFNKMYTLASDLSLSTEVRGEQTYDLTAETQRTQRTPT
jgi:hypothetical protein